MRRRAVLAVAALCVACGDTAGPYRMRDGQLAIAPVVADNPVAFIEVGAVRIRLTRIGEPTPFLDTTVAVSPNQTEFAIDLTVPIAGEAETMLLSLVLLDPAGVEVYRAQPDPTTVTVGISGSAATPITIPIEYCGPGADAVTLEITETDLSVYTGDTVRLSAIARDGEGQIVTDARVGWMALDPLLTFDDPKTGLARAGAVSGEARVVAMLPVLREGALPVEDTATITVRDNPPPTADAGEDITVIDTDLNGSEQATLNGAGSSDADGTIQSYVWSEGGNQIATGVGPTVSLTVGAHTITLTVTDDGGATASDDVVVTVTAGNQPPTANAGQDQTVTDTDLNGSEQVTLNGSGSNDADGTIQSYVWSEGGNQIATGVSPAVNLTVGAHTITLTVTDNGGATASDDVVVTVTAGNQPPTANAGQDQTVTDTDLNGSEQVTLNGSGSNDADGTIQSYVWSEGGNQIATGVSPAVNLTVGAHTITLTVTDNGGATASDDVVVTVTAGNQPPTANAGQDQTVTDTDLNGSEQVTLNGSGSNDADGTIQSYVWSEGGNQIATGVSPAVNLTVGAHTITLTVTDNGGTTGSDDVLVTVTAGNQPPTANAGQDQTVTDTDLNGSEQVTLNGSGSNDADGTIQSYVWSEGGNQIATGVSPAVNLTVGAHTITLTVTDNGGTTGSDDVLVTVTAGNQPPAANAGQDQTLNDADGTGAESVTLDGSGSNDPDGNIVSYVWSEGGNQIATGVGPAVNLTVGVHTITLTVTDDGDVTGTDQVVVTLVANQVPTANAGQDQTVTDTDLNGSEQVTLNGSGSNDADGTIQSYVWSEGGNQIATGVSPAVNLTVGAHTITLTVTDNGGATASDDVVVTVTAGNQPPIASAGQDLTFNDADGTGVESVTLDGSGSNDPDGNIVSYLWSEGGNQIASGVGPTVNLTVGVHTITLTVTDDGDATGTDQVVVTVVANQVPTTNAGQDQTVTDTDLNGSEQVTLNGSGSNDTDGTIVSYVWSEGGNQIATGVSPAVNLTVGAHTITLTVTDNGGAAASDDVVVTVTAGNQPPIASAGQDLTLNDADGTGAESVTLDGSGSNDPDGNIVSYVWSEGGNQIATGVGPAVNLTVGVHTITLTVTDDGDVTGTDQVVVTVVANQVPTANAGQDQTVTDTDLNGSEQVTLNGSGSNDADGTIQSYVWSEGGNQIATGVSPAVNLTVGAHTITLTVTDNGGATGTDQVIITVDPGQATLTVSGAGSGNGTVTSSPTGVNCTITDGVSSGDCTQSYLQGTMVTLVATPSATAGVHQFNGWSGTGETCPGTGPCDVTMDSNQNVTANFIEFHLLTVQGSGTGLGTVTGGGGIDCTSSGGETQGSCSALIEEGVSVALAANAEPGSSFTGWSGACSGTGSCQVTMSQAQTVTASFTLSMATLTLTIDGLGSVASQGATPALNCSYIEGQCSASYPWGTQVTLVASSLNPDFAWESWFGTGTGFTCTTSPTCVVTMDQDRDVRAWFSSPGLISVNPNTAAFTMLQAGTPTPASQTITVSNIGQRPVNLAATQISYTPNVGAWLNATIDKSVIDTLSPGTMTLSIIPNNLDPGVYTAAVYVGDFVVTTGQVNVTLTVSLPNPTITNVSWQLSQLNDSVICGNQNPPGSLFQFDMNYSDADGDVNQSTAVLTVAYQFNPGSAGQFQQPPEPGMSVSGNGFSGTITSYICNVFSTAASVTETFTLQDAQGNPSNSLSVTVPKPGGSNAPPAGNPVQDPTSSTSSGARVSGGSGL